MHSQLTLERALDEFYRVNAECFPESTPDDKARDFLRKHDIAHVIFGCDTTLSGEGKVKLWTIMGTTLGFWKHLKGYYPARAFELSRQYCWRHILKHLPRLFIALPRIWFRSRQMSKRWPWDNYSDYLDHTLQQIRHEFNINPL